MIRILTILSHLRKQKRKNYFLKYFALLFPWKKKKIPEMQTKPYSSCLPTDDIINMAVIDK